MWIACFSWCCCHHKTALSYCVIKIQTGFMLLAPSYPGFVGEKDVKRFFCDVVYFVSLIRDVYLTVVFCLVFPVVLQFYVVGWGKCVQSDLFCVTTKTWTQLSFCLAEGYQEAAEHFQNEANIEPDENASTLQERMQIREAVQSGKIENAFQLINSHFPGLLMSNDELHFQLQASVVSYLTATINSSRTKIQLFHTPGPPSYIIPPIISAERTRITFYLWR